MNVTSYVKKSLTHTYLIIYVVYIMKNRNFSYLYLCILLILVICILLFVYGYYSGSCKINKNYPCNTDFCLYKEFNVYLQDVIKKRNKGFN